MGYSVQNTETGEEDYIRCDNSSLSRHEFDEETGEPLVGEMKVRYIKHNRFQIPKKYLRTTVCEEFQREMTGDYKENFQPSDMQINQTLTSNIITVTTTPNSTSPSAGIKSSSAAGADAESEQYLHRKNRKTQTQHHRYNYEYYMRSEGVKSEIILGYNKQSARLFLIPTLFYFDAHMFFILAILELFLHFWAHKTNGLNMNKHIYYRSPLHVLTSQFCATCRSESAVEIQVLQILNQQMRKARESHSLKLKNVTKAMG